VIKTARTILNTLGVQLHPQKTRIVHVRYGFEFLGYKIKQGKQLKLPPNKIRSGAQSGKLYAIPKESSVKRFMDQVRSRTRRKAPLKTEELIEQLNPVLRGWGQYYKRAHIRKLFNRHKRWRCAGWKALPTAKLYGEYGLVNLVGLIPSLAAQRAGPS
jgi:RNA-directed DNA polymerase